MLLRTLNLFEVLFDISLLHSLVILHVVRERICHFLKCAFILFCSMVDRGAHLSLIHNI